MSTLRAGRLTSRGTTRQRALQARFAIARLIALIGSLVAFVLAVAILLVVLGANRDNEIVRAVVDAGRWLAGPFDGMFNLRHHRTEIAVNWGIAAVVYFALSRLLARVVAR
jgi:hypothetical protein